MFAVTILCGRYPKATELNLRGCPCVDEVLVQEAMLSLRLVILFTFLWVFWLLSISSDSSLSFWLAPFFGFLHHVYLVHY